MAPFPHPSMDEARDILRDAMTSTAERDIYTGDAVQIAILTADGLKIEEFPLPAH
jgi:20S proteasome subunit beta 6